jgi:hypothetical protein
METEQVFTARQNVYARQQPFSLNEQIAQTNAAGELAGAAQKAFSGNLVGASVDMASAYAKRDTSRYLKEMQGLDKLIERAMASYAKTPGAGPKPLIPAVPSMTGTPMGVGKRFTSGPFKGQTWAVINGVVTKVK